MERLRKELHGLMRIVSFQFWLGIMVAGGVTGVVTNNLKCVVVMAVGSLAAIATAYRDNMKA